MASNQVDFVPYSSQLGITGSSYMLQVGKVNDFWAIRLIKGKDVLDSKIFKDETDKDMPNANKLTGWVLSVLAIPNLNTYQIQKTIGFIRQQAVRSYEAEQIKKKQQGKAESGSVNLASPPEKDIHRPKTPGWIKEETPEFSGLDESTTQSQPVTPKSSPSSSSGPRKLPTIPHGDGFTESSSPGPISTSTSSLTNNPVSNHPTSSESPEIKSKLEDLLTRLDSLENRVHSIEQELKNKK